MRLVEATLEKSKLFEYVILHHEAKTKKHDDEGTQPKTTLVQDVKRVLAVSEREVLLIAAREVPEQYLDRLAEVEIGVRPF